MPNSASGIPYPAGSTAPAGAAQMQALAEFLDGRTVLPATDETNRDELYGDYPAPVVVASKARPAVWLKVADTGTSADWRTVYQDSGWVTTGFTASTANFTITSAAVRRIGSVVHFRGEFNAAQEFACFEAISDQAGNIAGDPLIVIMPSGYAPTDPVTKYAQSSFGSFGTRVYTDGSIRLTDGPPRAHLLAGTSLKIDASWVLD